MQFLGGDSLSYSVLSLTVCVCAAAISHCSPPLGSQQGLLAWGSALVRSSSCVLVVTKTEKHARVQVLVRSLQL